MIHRGEPTGRSVVRGAMIPGLHITMKAEHYTFGEAGDGHEWYIEHYGHALELDADGVRASLWHHSPVVCPKCQNRIEEHFPRPMGVQLAERGR